jgi:hypothetical protein
LVRYFKINDPYRLLTLFLFIVVTRTIILLYGFPFTGIHSGYFSGDNGQHLGSLFLWMTELIGFIFRDPLIPSFVLSAILVFLQAFSLNSILIRSKALSSNTYLPAACYILILSASPEFMVLSPAMFAITFVLIGINYMLFHLQYRGSEENILSTGVVFGLASLFDPSSTIFILLIFAIYIFYSNTLNRRYLLLVYGLVFPYLLIWIYYLWKGEGQEFWVQTSQNIFSISSEYLIPLNQLAVLISLPLLIAFISAIQTITGVGLTVLQIVTQKTLLLLGFFAIGAVFLNDQISANSLIYLAPTLAFFISQFLLTRERKWLSEAVFVLLLIWSLTFLILPILAPSLLPISYGLLR